MIARKCLGNNRGQSIIEIGLITPLLLAVLYVAFDFGIAYFTAHYTQNAVREAVRYAALLPDCSIDSTVPCVGTTQLSCPGSATGAGAVVQAACQRIPNLLTTPQLDVTLSGTLTSTCRRMVTVTASGTYNYGLYHVMALIGLPLTSNTFQISRSAEARYEIQPVNTTTTNC